MKSLAIIVVIVTALALSAQTASANCGGCKSDAKANVENEAAQQTAEKTCGEKAKFKAQKLCLKCGQVKGTKLCCKPDQKLCKGCGLVKGSPGCCKIPKDAKSAFYCPETKKVVTSKKDCPYLKGKAAKDALAPSSSGACSLGK